MNPKLGTGVKGTYDFFFLSKVLARIRKKIRIRFEPSQMKIE
jgi:hypothetical protein